MNIDKTFKVGDIEVRNGVFLAPMEGITDLPFRKLCRRYGADIVYTEFVASEALVRDIDKSLFKIRVHDEERPVAVQIFGSDPDAMAEAARMVEDAGADILDINYGCWVKKVVSHNAGAALLKDTDRMNAITSAVAKAVKIPVTVKTRLGWDRNNIIINEVAKMQEQAGAKAITVHCRTRDMGMTGKADWSYIPKIKEGISIPLILNGDIVSPETAKAAMEVEGADAIMIGRAVLGNPFIFRDSKNHINTGILNDKPNINERFDVLIEHLKFNIEDKGHPRGLMEFRKHFSGYLKGLYNASAYRQRLVLLSQLDETIELLEEFRHFLIKRETEGIAFTESKDTVEPINCNLEE